MLLLFQLGCAVKKIRRFKVADLNFDCATFCVLPSFGAVTTFSSQKVSMKGRTCAVQYIFFSIITRNKLYNLFMPIHCSCHCFQLFIISSLVK